MKRINILLGFLALFILSSCNSIKINEMNPIIALDTVISITFYNSDNYLECYNDIKKIYYNVDDIADDFNSKNGNVYDLNSNREIKMNKDLKELIDEGKLSFEQLYDQDNKVTVGERIVTSNISEKYVEGLFIGYVSEIQQDPNNLTKTGTIVTPVDFGHLKDVFVITTNKQDAIDKSEDASNEK